jgi:hypothetical protein
VGFSISTSYILQFFKIHLCIETELNSVHSGPVCFLGNLYSSIYRMAESQLTKRNSENFVVNTDLCRSVCRRELQSCELSIEHGGSHFE